MNFKDFSFSMISKRERENIESLYGKHFDSLAKDVYNLLEKYGVSPATTGKVLENPMIWGELLSADRHYLMKRFSRDFGNESRERAFYIRLNARFY